MSVVVPTMGRSELARALASAKEQSGAVAVETVVVVDHPEPYPLPPAARAWADQVLYTGGSVGGSEARNIGVRSSTGDFVAFLDDDDEWLPEKLRVQLAILASAPDPERAIVSSRHVHRDAKTGRTSGPLPRRVKEPRERVARYLFRRRRPSGGRASVYTSTLLCARDLALNIEWARLPRHQDWDWLIRAERAGAVVVQSPEALVFVQTGSAGSVSAGTDWSDSLEWAKVTFADDRQVFADFVAAQTLRYAIAGRSWAGVAAVLRQLIHGRKLPSLGPLVIGLGGLIPRSAIETIMVRFR